METNYFRFILACLAAILVDAQDILVNNDAAVVCPSGYTWNNGRCTPNESRIGQPVCPDDFWWNGTQCEKLVALCPVGFVQNRATGVCERISGVTVLQGPASCPSGYYYNDQRNLCYPSNPCPAGLVYSNGRCEQTVSVGSIGGIGVIDGVGSILNGMSVGGVQTEIYEMSVAPECQSGYTYNSLTGSCETTITTNADPTCLRGRLVNGACVYQQTQQPSCPSGYSYENGQCVRKRYVAPTSCPYGYVLDGNVCRGSEQVSPKCPFNTELRGNECVRIESALPTCGFGSVYRNGRCETSTSSAPTCPSDHEYINGNCVKIVVNAPNCPSGYEYDRGTCVRKVVIPLECPPGYNMRNGMCSRLEIKSPMCPVDAQLEGGSCVYIEYVSYRCPDGFLLTNGICERSSSEPPRCPPEYKLNYEGKCEKLVIYRPTPPPREPIRPIYRPTPPSPIRLTCPTVGPIPPCPNCPVQKCETSTCRENCPMISPPQVVMPPINNYVNNNNTVHSPINITSSNINTITITAASNCRRGTKTVKTGEGSSTVIHQECIEDEEEKEAEIIEMKTEKKKCCTVVGPRQCQRQSNEWQCFHRRHHRCGEFCSKETIQLRPSRPVYRQNVLVMPPPPRPPPQMRQIAYVMQAPMPMQHFDCSTCLRSYSRCPSQCYQYDCEGGNCEYMDQSSFCNTYGGEGCSVDDGCLEGEGCY